jgi:16S rRNA (cytosine1402-N4)-methyltransferase
MSNHTPVLLNETLDLLQPERGGVFVDGTLGMGGHSAGLLERAAGKMRIIGIDQDPYALEFAEEKLGDSIEYLEGNFAELLNLRKKGLLEAADGILLDIGVSSYQLDTPERGFSFQHDGPLDMRMNQDQGLTSGAIINTWPEFKLAQLFEKYGEERLAKKIARAIVDERKKGKIQRTGELAEIIIRQYHPPARHKKPHPATRVFQALRIEVNRELESLEKGIEAALELLAPGGILAIITFHSLEDRIVKYRFRDAAATEEYEILTKKPIVAGRPEQIANPRSRSAKLRGIRRREH